MHVLSTKWGPIVASVLVGLVFFGALLLLIERLIPDNSFFETVTGALLTEFTGMCRFWLGSSAGSKAKDDIVARSPPISS